MADNLIIVSNNQYSNLIDSIGEILQKSKQQIATSVNTILVDTYWQIGKYIVEFEQQGSNRAEYGDNLINRLSHDLTSQYGKGFSKSNLLYMRKFYSVFQKSETVSHLLSWSHYFEILKLDDPLEISFYVRQCEIEQWSVRELKPQKSHLLTSTQPTALSTSKAQLTTTTSSMQQVA